MKEREFDLENYKQLLIQKCYLLIQSKISLNFNGFEFKISKLGRNNFNNGFDFESMKCRDILNIFDNTDVVLMVDELKEEFEVKKQKTIEQFRKTKAIVDTILFDDKDYQELLIAIDSIYYCQAETMLRDVVDAKLKGKTAKAMKYQARKMALLNDVSCD